MTQKNLAKPYPNLKFVTLSYLGECRWIQTGTSYYADLFLSRYVAAISPQYYAAVSGAGDQPSALGSPVNVGDWGYLSTTQEPILSAGSGAVALHLDVTAPSSPGADGNATETEMSQLGSEILK